MLSCHRWPIRQRTKVKDPQRFKGSCKRTAHSEGKGQWPGRLQMEGVSGAYTAGLHLSHELILPRPGLSTLSQDLLRIFPSLPHLWLLFCPTWTTLTSVKPDLEQAMVTVHSQDSWEKESRQMSSLSIQATTQNSNNDTGLKETRTKTPSLRLGVYVAW